MDITKSLVGVKSSKKSKKAKLSGKKPVSAKQTTSTRKNNNDSESDEDLHEVSEDQQDFEDYNDNSNVVQDSDDDDDDAGFIQGLLDKKNIKEGKEVVKRQKNLKTNKETIGGGSFQSMGLKPSLLKTLLMRGFTNPTPIQRSALPAILASPPRDVVGMARTGSGKTLAYMIPLIQRLGAVHNSRFGCRSLILVPTRELALQVLKVGKDLSRTSREKDSSNSTEGLRWGLIVGGDSMEDQFKTIAANPDVLIATPGRLLHLIVEMNLDLKSAEYVVFDEADRLFELGFAVQLHEILHRLPSNRQTVLFSATLPKSLVEFAKAGLQNPKLIRLDADTKISSDLQMAFFNIKPDEKIASLMSILRDVIKVPYGENDVPYDNDSDNDNHEHNNGKRFSKKRKRKNMSAPKDMASHQTIVFAATKHHVELLEMLLKGSGYATSTIYGSMDQAARSSNLNQFRNGRTNILVVTDLAARGIDIPILENVINYDFPTGPKQFIHRVGRTARAGRKGWAYSLVTRTELPYLLDLQLFLSRPLQISTQSYIDQAKAKFTNDTMLTDLNLSANIVLGTIPRDIIDMEIEHIQSTLIGADVSISSQLGVVQRAQKMYERSQAKASSESHRRAKEFLATSLSSFGESSRPDTTQNSEHITIHPVYSVLEKSLASSKDKKSQSSATVKTATSTDQSKAALLRAIESFQPSETTFEIGKRGKTPMAKLMQDRRSKLTKSIEKRKLMAAFEQEGKENEEEENDNDEILADDQSELLVEKDKPFEEEADEAQLQDVFEMSKSSGKKSSKKSRQAKDFRDENFFLQYAQEGAETEKGYSVGGEDLNQQGLAALNNMTYDVVGEDEDRIAQGKPSQLRWDRKNKKFVKGDGVGADNVKLVKTESGVRLPATYRSGVYDEWKNKSRLKVPKIGDQELPGSRSLLEQRRQFRHNQRKGPSKPSQLNGKGGKARSSLGKKESKSSGVGGSGVKSADQIAKDRRLKASRTRRSNQPSRKKK